MDSWNWSRLMMRGHCVGSRRKLMFTRPSRRAFLAVTGLAAVSAAVGVGQEKENVTSPLPKGPSPEPLPLPHFPDRLHAFIWRNWPLVPIDKLASVLHTNAKNVAALANSMGLPTQPRITTDQLRRSYITIIKRNWHLLPYSQLLELLGWSADELAYTLREDDFLFIKLGNLKPNCPSLSYTPPTPESTAHAHRIASVVNAELGGLKHSRE